MTGYRISGIPVPQTRRKAPKGLPLGRLRSVDIPSDPSICPCDVILTRPTGSDTVQSQVRSRLVSGPFPSGPRGVAAVGVGFEPTDAWDVTRF